MTGHPLRPILRLWGIAAIAGLPMAALSVPAAAQTETTVTVQNNLAVPVSVFVEYGALDRRLGIVEALTVDTLRLPEWMVEQHESIQLFAERPDGMAMASGWFECGPGQHWAMMVPGGEPMAAPEMKAQIPIEELAETTLTVENPGDLDATIFAEEGPFEVRLGRVAAGDAATLSIPRTLVSDHDELVIFVQREGTFDLTSHTLKLKKGEHLGLRIPAR